MKDLLKNYSQVFIPGSMGIKAPAVFNKRRSKLLRSLDSFAVFTGVEFNQNHSYSWVSTAEKIFQDPALMYLCGINQPGIILLLNPLAKSIKDKSILFVPSKNDVKEYWDGVSLGIDVDDNKSIQEIKTLTGFSTVLLNTEFDNYLSNLLISLKKEVFYSNFIEYSPKLQNKAEFSWKFKQKLERIKNKVRPELRLYSILKMHLKDRVIIDEYQLLDLKRAVSISNYSFRNLLPEVKTYKNEREIVSKLEYGIAQKTSHGVSFSTICGSGKNACTLHYIKNDQKICPNSLILMDFGARVANAFADVSRTIPSNGRFNPLQKLLYSIVLKVQKNNEKRVKAGVRISELDRATWFDMESLLQKNFVEKGGKMNRYASPSSNKSEIIKPHGVSHLIGWQVHEGDPFRLYSTEKLKPGMLISNEPGLYGEFSIKIDGKFYSEYIGIRIEDDLLITKDSCINLTKKIPKEIASIEAIM